MAATRKDRGNSWASRAPLNDDRAPIVANTRRPSGQACRSNFFKLRMQLQVVVLSCADWWTHYPPPNCGLERTSRLRRDVGTDRQKIFFVEW